jgi:hypothetical protein
MNKTDVRDGENGSADEAHAARQFRRRLAMLGGVALAGILLLTARLVWLQVIARP